MSFENIYIKDLATQYYDITFDEIFKTFFDENSNNNIEYKIKVLEWAIKNKNNVANYENYDENIMLEKYPQTKIWDL